MVICSPTRHFPPLFPSLFVLSDLRLAVRSLSKSPGFVVVAALTLALGIAANTTFLSVLHGVVLRPLPFAQPEELVELRNQGEALGANVGRVSRAELRDYRERQRSFTGIGSHAIGRVTLGLPGGAERVLYAQVTANFFPLLGVAPTRGRNFEETEETAGRDRVVIVSHGFWQTQLGGTAEVLQRTVPVNGIAHQVVGVMPAGFVYEDAAIAFWKPVDLSAQGPSDRSDHYLPAIGRLAPGVSLAAANADMARVAETLRAQAPADYPAAPRWSLRVLALAESHFGQFRTPLAAMLAAAAAVLLIAAVNVAIMFLLRAAGRRRDIMIRLSLGAARRHIVRQLLAESAVVCILGGAAGLLLAVAGIALLKTFPPADVPRLAEVSLNVPTALLSLGILVLVTLAIGLAPAIPLLRARVPQGLNASTRTTESRAASRAREILLVAEIALAFLLLVGGGLVVRSLHNLLNDDVGFTTQRLFTFKTNLTPEGAPDLARANQWYAQLTERIVALPGVTAVAGVSYLPLSGESQFMAATPLAPGIAPTVDTPGAVGWRVVRGPYFATVGTTLRHGRDFAPTDTATSPLVTIVDDEFARRYWADSADAVGQSVRFGSGERAQVRTIVGVVHRLKHWGPGRQPVPEAYVPQAQFYQRGMYTVVRTDAAPAALGAAIRAELAAVDPTVPMYFVDTMEHRYASALAMPRFTAGLLGTFSLLALLLAGVGIFGVIGYATAQRSREFGIRFAIGASRAHVVRLVLSRVGLLALVGGASGAIAAFQLARLIRSQLYGIEPTDSTTLLGAMALLVVAALLASLAPLAAALRVNPADALRSE